MYIYLKKCRVHNTIYNFKLWPNSNNFKSLLHIPVCPIRHQQIPSGLVVWNPPLPYSTKLGGPETLEVQVFKACTDFEVAPGIKASLETTFFLSDWLLLDFLVFWWGFNRQVAKQNKTNGEYRGKIYSDFVMSNIRCTYIYIYIFLFWKIHLIYSIISIIIYHYNINSEMCVYTYAKPITLWSMLWPIIPATAAVQLLQTTRLYRSTSATDGSRTHLTSKTRINWAASTVTSNNSCCLIKAIPREWSHIPPGEKENHLQIDRGYVSFHGG